MIKGYRTLAIVISLSAWATVACTKSDSSGTATTMEPSDQMQQMTETGDGETDGAAAPMSSTLNVVKSGLGESCLVTDHCDTDLGLVCVANTCINPGAAQTSTGDDAGTPPLPNRLGQSGESCRSRGDCDLGLACVANTCVPMDSLSTPEVDAGTVPLSVGQEGESCASRADCAQGLACIASRCVQGSSGLQPTGKECVVIECSEPVDCCPELPSYCPTLEASCMASPTSTACTQFDMYCKCDGTFYDCTDNRCVSVECREAADCCPTVSTSCPLYKQYCDDDPTSTYCDTYDLNCVCDESLYRCAADQCETVYQCQDDVDCPSTQVCDQSANVCVECMTEMDCTGTAAVCVDNKCIAGCERNEECPLFNECVAGECIEVGCKTDRECKAYTGDLQAVCQDGDCRVRCNSDFECGTNMICVDNGCVSAGCETDEECRIQLASVGSAYEIVCRAPQ